jgi:hypothetical protein
MGPAFVVKYGCGLSSLSYFFYYYSSRGISLRGPVRSGPVRSGPVRSAALLYLRVFASLPPLLR